ncbi:MAG: glucose-6-phosphate isomerase family protein [Candidatus Diapherotrites archaeon]
MIDLTKNCGFPVYLNEKKLFFPSETKQIIPDIRTIKQMQSVLRTPKSEWPNECYYMYRGVNALKDEKKINSIQLRFDLTVIPPALLGEEFNKTFGHFHPKNSAGTYFPEIYEVISGKALYLLQKTDGAEFYAVNAKQGQKLIIPPGFGHVTINPSLDEVLVMANWIEKNFKSDYGNIKENHGAMHYFTHYGFEENMNYAEHVKAKELNAVEFPKLSVTKKPMYLEGISNPEKFDWLVKPEEYGKEFKEYLKELIKKKA